MVAMVQMAQTGSTEPTAIMENVQRKNGIKMDEETKPRTTEV